MNPQVFGKEHLTYVIISMVVAFAVCYLAKCYAKTEKQKTFVIKGAAVVLFLIIFTNRLALVFEYDTANWMKLITDSFCSTSSYVLSIALLLGKKNNNVLHFIWLIALGGGTIATFYPNFIGQHPSFLYPPTILGMMHHTWSAIVIVLVLMFGYIELTYKKWYCTLFGFTAYIAFGAFLMCELGYTNPFYMTAPALDGTIFTVWGILPIYIAIYALIMLIVELVRRKKTAKNKQNLSRPITTLFMLSSVDGKISTGATDELDVDKDFPKIAGVGEGLHQYYEIEQTTDLWSLNTGRVQAKIGANKKPMPQKSPVSFVLVDNKHLTEHGVRYFCALSDKFVLITTNEKHPAFQVQEENLHIIYQTELSLLNALSELKSRFGCERITVQSGGTLNGLFLREKLFDYVDIVVAPVLIGGKDTSSLVDGNSLRLESELSSLGVLELQDCTVLENSYLRLKYKVVK